MIATLALEEVALEVREVVSRRLADGMRASPNGFANYEDVWSALAELGCLAAPLPEENGGMGGGVADAIPILEPLGRHGLAIPFLDGVCVPAAIATMVANPAALNHHLAQASTGGRPLALAWTEPDNGWSRTPALTSAVPLVSGWELNGSKTAMRWAGDVAAFIVSAKTETGPALFLVPAGSAGLNVVSYPTADFAQAGDIHFEGLRLPLTARLDAGDDAATALDVALDAGAALSLAEAAGAMDRCLEMTIAYLRTREQFGSPLSRLQALHHRLVDAYSLCETSWSLVLDAVAALDPKTPAHERARRVSTAKAHVGPAGRQVAQEALQLHGAIGMTMEYPLGRYLSRLTLIDLGYGDANWHLDRIARCLEANHDAS